MSKKRRLRTLSDVQRRYKAHNPIIIDGWDHLKEWYAEHGPSATHEIVFEKHSAHIQVRKDRLKDGVDGWDGFYYLSTHTFYGHGSWLDSTIALVRANFTGIIIRNWDAKEEGQNWPERCIIERYNKDV